MNKDCERCVHRIASKNFINLSKACAEFIVDLEQNSGKNSFMLLEKIKQNMSKKYVREKNESKN